MSYVQDKDVAEEIVQETFVKFWQKLESLTIHTSPLAYLHTAIRNASLNHLKHLKVRREHAQQQEEHPTEWDQGNVIDAKILQGKIRHAMDQLPEKCRAIFELSRNEGLTYSEIAQQLDISVKTVENQMGKALKVLREHLGDFLFWSWIVESVHLLSP